MRSEDNFISLLENKKIVIPIIQRDYAQGRKNEKAKLVRQRLIDDLIEALNNNEKRIDFNYIYGNATKDIFYPVDGQQRLTSLYLLYWYLAFANGSQELIEQWDFEYQTRNSALEFFSFLKNTEKSIDLYLLLSTQKDEEKENSIKNKSWFKTKWENDPTITACIQFLIMLTSKLESYKADFNKFWNRLLDKDSAVYFTFLTEENEEHAEINAAKKYTRMNARGKKLTEFENLKAIIDEIENNEINNLEYCTELNNGIIFKYDKLYIQRLYNFFQNQDSTLNDIVFNINMESIEWFKKIYKVYCYLYKMNNLCNLDDTEELYENEMYNISQKRIEDNNINKYLYMLKAVHEVLYNSTKEKIIYTNSDFDNDKQQIAFIIFIFHMWNKENKQDENLKIVEGWKRFNNMISDLDYQNWENEKWEFVSIIDNVVEQIAKTQGVNCYFANNDFKINNPLKNVKLQDILCRIEEQQVKSKLLIDNVISNYTYFDKIAMSNGRFGYFLYITDCMESWQKGLNMNANKEKIESYLRILTENRLPYEGNQNESFLKSYAYASQINSDTMILDTQENINRCNNEHIWRGIAYLNWCDGETAEQEMIHINHLKTTMKLIDQYVKETEYVEKGIFDKFVEHINNWFDNSTGYEKCWLRIAMKNNVNTEEILGDELENKNGIVTVIVDDISIILKIYLLEKSYNLMSTHEKRIDIASTVKKKIFCNNKANLYSRVQIVLTFEPNLNDDEKYRHSKDPQIYLSERSVSRNIDIEYEANLNIQDDKYLQSQVFSYEYLENGIEISIYEIGEVSNNQVEINISKSIIDSTYIKLIEEKKLVWKKEYQEIENSRQLNYDKWIELWYLSEKNNKFEFFNNNLPGKAELKCSRQQRPNRKWIESIDIQNLEWKGLKDTI